ncbi:MAG: hypothetical protein ACMUIM_08460 [bacterium]
MVDELFILKEVIKRLNNAGIPYMISGSMALNYYTEPRMTRDIDIVIELKQDDSNRVYNLFKDDFYVDLRMIESAIKKEGMFNIIHLEEIIKIDFIIRKSTPYRRLEFERKKKIRIEDMDTYIVSIEDLILSKLFWAKDSRSAIQLADAKNLINESNVDMNYIDKWAPELGIKDLLAEILK